MTNWLATLTTRAGSGDAASASYLAAIQANAARNGQSPSLLAQIIGDESGYDANSAPVYANSHPVGLGQIQPGTADDPGYGVAPLGAANRTDPIASIGFTSDMLAVRPQAYQTYDQASSETGSTQTGSLNGSYSTMATPIGVSPSVIGSTGAVTNNPNGSTTYSYTDPTTGLPVTGTVNSDGSVGAATMTNPTTNSTTTVTPMGAIVDNLSNFNRFFIRAVLVVLGIGMLFIALSMLNDNKILTSATKGVEP